MGDLTGWSSPPLRGADVGVGNLWEGRTVSPALSELPTELKVFADVEVKDALCPPEDCSTGELGAFGSWSLVFFFLRNPRFGIDALVWGGGGGIQPASDVRSRPLAKDSGNWNVCHLPARCVAVCWLCDT